MFFFRNSSLNFVSIFADYDAPFAQELVILDMYLIAKLLVCYGKTLNVPSAPLLRSRIVFVQTTKFVLPISNASANI